MTQKLTLPKDDFDRMWNGVLPCQRRCADDELFIRLTQRNGEGTLEAIEIHMDTAAVVIVDPKVVGSVR